MKILVISNFYPPYELGGWEQLTQELVDRLLLRGHTVVVLTGDFHSKEVNGLDNKTIRKLKLECYDFQRYSPWFLLTLPFFENWNRRVLEKILNDFQPDLIFIHSMWNLHRSVAYYAEKLLPGKVVYYVASDWPYQPGIHENFWQAPTRRSSLRGLKRTLSIIPRAYLFYLRQQRYLKFEHVICVSRAIRENLNQYANIPLQNSCVIYNGIDTNQFAPPQNWDPTTWRDGSPALIYAGSLIPLKGVHTAIKGFAIIVSKSEHKNATLTIVGDGPLEYKDYLSKLVEEKGLSDQVFFCGRVERKRLPEILSRHDILLIPSHYEALSRIMQEGMSCGLAVIGTTSWGSKELLKENETGLTFEPEDAVGLARQIERIIWDPELKNRVVLSGRQAVVEHFNLDLMVDEVETYLLDLLNSKK